MASHNAQPIAIIELQIRRESARIILRRMGTDKCALTPPPVASLPSGYTDEVVVWVDEWRDLRFRIIPIYVEYHVASERNSDIRDP
jgi:hypothetical protein